MYMQVAACVSEEWLHGVLATLGHTVQQARIITVNPVAAAPDRLGAEYACTAQLLLGCRVFWLFGFD
jgi:hypothetical protein